VQDYVIGNLLEMVRMGFDGVSLIFQRGLHIGFEAPVVEKFAEKHPDINPYVLPISDERLHGIWCEIMTGFMRKLRKELDNISKKRLLVNAFSYYGLLTAKHLGLDAETWAKEGLTDIVSQSDTEIFEDLDGCMNESDPSVIDLEKYSAKLKMRPVIKKNDCTDVDKVCAHIPEYTALKKKYGVEVYHVLPWIHSLPYKQVQEAIEKMKKAGAEKFLAWNGYDLHTDLPEYHTIMNAGRGTDPNIRLRRFVHVISLANNDISQFNANWWG